MKLLAILVLALVCVSCSGGKSGGWVRENGTKRDLQNDYAECSGPADVRARHAETISNSISWASLIPFAGALAPIGMVATSQASMTKNRQEIAACMRDKGYDWKEDR